jgi:hypothetical protein
MFKIKNINAAIGPYVLSFEQTAAPKWAQWAAEYGSTAYLGAWIDAAMVRAEFEFVRAGVLTV